VLALSFLSYRKDKNLTSHRIKTPDPIEIKFGMVDYIGEMALTAKVQANLHNGVFSASR